MEEPVNWRGSGKRARSVTPQKVPKKKNRSLISREDRVYNRDPQGNEMTNRRGRPLCAKFQTGECTTLPCPQDSNNAHQCSSA